MVVEISEMDKKKIVDMLYTYREELIDKYGFTVYPIRVQFNARKYKVYGTCSCNHRAGTAVIEISNILIKEGSEEAIKETLLHELIHAMPYCKMNHHGAKFQEMARKVNRIYGTKIGTYASKEAYDSVREVVKANVLDNRKTYVCHCAKCGATWRYHRMSKFVKAVMRNGAKNYTCQCGGKEFYMD